MSNHDFSYPPNAVPRLSVEEMDTKLRALGALPYHPKNHTSTDLGVAAAQRAAEKRK